jgi:hypothetical protein
MSSVQKSNDPECHATSSEQFRINLIKLSLNEITVILPAVWNEKMLWGDHLRIGESK